MIRVFLKKNDLTKNPKLPYFTITLPPNEEAGEKEWKTIGALWKAKTGNGYSGQFEEGVVIDTSKMKVRAPKEPELPEGVFTNAD